MPLIQVLYDDSKLSEDDMVRFCRAVKEIVSEATGIKEVFVWGNSASIKIDVDPIEVIIEMSDHKVGDLESLTNDICKKLTEWKNSEDFKTPATVTLIPMNWKFVVGV